MKVCLAQINPVVGDLKGNSVKILSIAKKIKADLIAFPELSLTGYCPMDLILKRQFVDDNISELKNLAEKIRGKSIIIGFIDKKAENLFNAAAVISNGKIAHIYHKQCLPNYSIFDEKRWFKEGTESKIFELNGKKIGINICEDIWFTHVCKAQKAAGADFFINISASPYSKIKIGTIEKTLLQRYKENEKPILYVNQVGAQDGIVYYGHSMFVNNNKILKKAKDFEEDFIMVNI